MLNLQEIIQSMPIRMRSSIKAEDTDVLTMAAREFVQSLKNGGVIVSQRQMVLTVDNNLTATIPEEADPNGKMIVAVCDCGQLVAVDIGNNVCPTNLKIPTCECAEPSPCSQTIGELCKCCTCDKTIGYAFDPFFWNANNPFGSWWNSTWYYPTGRIDSRNKFGSCSVDGRTIHFTKDLRNCDVYFLYEARQDVADVLIAEDWLLACQYYLVAVIKEDTDLNAAKEFHRLSKVEVREVEKNWFRKTNFASADTVNRIMSRHVGTIKV